MESKKKVVIIIAVVILSCFLLAYFLNSIHIVKEYHFDYSVDSNWENPYNYLQNKHDFSAYLYNGSLFFYIDGSDNSNYEEGLYKVSGSSSKKILSFKSTYIEEELFFCKEAPLLFINGSLLYCVNSTDIDKCAIVSFDIDTLCSNIISTGEKAKKQFEIIKGNYAIFEQNDSNVLYFRIFNDDYPFLAVSDTKIEYVDSCNNYSVNGSFTFGKFNYYWEDDIWLTQISSNNNRIAPLVPAEPIYAELDGESIIVTKAGSSGFWMISKNGEIVQLFPSIEGEKVIIAYQVYGTNLFISVRRYKKYEEYNIRRFKNDSYEGLWKVDLLSGEKEKISTVMYRQLYIYDDSGIIACSYSNDIVLLDFNGRKKTTIVAGSLFDHLDEFHRNHFSIAS